VIGKDGPTPYLSAGAREESSDRHSPAPTGRHLYEMPALIRLESVKTQRLLSGVQQVEVYFVPIEQIAALPVDVRSEEAQTLLDAASRVWLPAALGQPGSIVSTWSIQIPTELGGEYQIDLRGRDALGNQAVSANLWRGVIGT
jgi:hypothetical protein